MRDFMAITKALSDENRVRIMLMLQDGELCVCQIIEVLGLAASTVSKHLSILHQARLVDSLKRGRWVYYCLPGKSADTTVQAAIQWVQQCVGTSNQAQEDAAKLEKVLKVSPEELCKSQA